MTSALRAVAVAVAVALLALAPLSAPAYGDVEDVVQVVDDVSVNAPVDIPVSIDLAALCAVAVLAEATADCSD